MTGDILGRHVGRMSSVSWCRYGRDDRAGRWPRFFSRTASQTAERPAGGAGCRQRRDRPAGTPWIGTEEIANAARLTGLSEPLIRQVMDAESAGAANAVSPKGAMGLMQLMPDTYKEMSADLGLGADPFNPRDNVLAGAVFLKKMLDRFGSPAFLAAYNAGPQCLDEVLAGLRPLPDESRAFMEKVAAQFGMADAGFDDRHRQPGARNCSIGRVVFRVSA